MTSIIAGRLDQRTGKVSDMSFKFAQFSAVLLLLSALNFVVTECSGEEISQESSHFKSDTVSEASDEFFELFPEARGIAYRLVLERSENIKNKVIDPATSRERVAHGVCIFVDRTVKLNYDFVTTGNYYQIKKVVFHELSHCLLGLVFHPDDKYEYTIMNQILDTALIDGDNWGYLKGELRLRYLRHINKTKKK